MMLQLETEQTSIKLMSQYRPKLCNRLRLLLLLLSYWCLVTVYVLWLFLTVVWVGLQCVIVLNPDHTHSLYKETEKKGPGV